MDYLASFPKSRLFFREKHAMEDSFFVSDKTHSIATTLDYQVHPDLNKYADLFYDKTRYSAFYDTDLGRYIKQIGVKTIGIMGVETHTSILFTVEELRNMGYEVSVIEPCTMSRDDAMHGFAISLMNHWFGVKIVNG